MTPVGSAAFQALIEQADARDDVLVEDPHLRAHLAHLAADGRKLIAHLRAELRNLQRQCINSGRQFLQCRHALLEAIYP